MIDKIRERLELYRFDIQKVVSKVLEKYGFPYESVVQDEIHYELDNFFENKDTINIINQVEAEYNNGWISVDDRLPEKFDSVLVSCKGSVVGGENAGECAFVATGYMFSKDHWQIQGHSDVKYIKVIAWQPLPQPPKGE